MNKLKKIVSSMLATLMFFSVSTSNVFASVSQDVINTKYKTHAKILGALGIMVGDANTGAFRPDDAIKRSEATKIGVALIGLTSAANSSAQNSSYPDVDKNYWANGFINTGTLHGLVIGDDTGYFRPEDQIKFSEVATILVRALGYEVQAKSKGGYPTGYISVASSIGLTKGINAAADKLISRGDVAIMAYNALRINLMEQTGFGSNVKYEITDKTLLEDKLDFDYITGKVEAVGSSVLDGGSPISKNEIRISGKKYDAGNSDIRTVLGFNVEAYLNNKTKKVVAVVPKDGENEVLNINADAISSVENTASAKVVNYWKDESAKSKISKANVAGDAHVVYNGKISDFGKFRNINSGYMSLLDSDLNGIYDIVFVNETTNYVVDEVYTSSKKITDKYENPAMTLDFDDKNKTVILEKANEYISLSDLKEWDVITFTISEDGSIIFGNVVRDSLEGKVTEISDDYVYIGDKKFDVASNYPDILNVNDEGVFYLDHEGKIAAFKRSNQKSANYAYLENADVTTGFNKTIKLELFTMEGKVEVLDGAQKITVNSQKNLSPDAALSAIGNDKQLITYEKDAQGKVKKIVTSTVSQSINENAFTLNMTEDDVVYNEATSKLTGSDMSVTITSDTVIFDIPENKGKENYSIGSKNTFADGGLYDVMVFDVSENFRAGAVVVTNSETKADEASDIALVEKITVSNNSNGDTVHKLYAYAGGKAINVTSKDQTTFLKQSGNLIKEGDIIQYRTNAGGTVDAITVLFDTEAENNEAKTKLSDNLTTVYGRVTKKFADSVNVQVGNSVAQNYSISNATVYVYDSSLNKNKITVGDLSSIERYENDGGKVFMRIYKNEVKEIVVIK